MRKKNRHKTRLNATVVVNVNKRVLLIQPKGSSYWRLPERQIQHRTSIALTAVQAVQKETGLEVKLMRLVGIYAPPYWPGNKYGVVFDAIPVGGTLCEQECGVNKVQYFPSDALPEGLLWWHQQPIQEALSGVGRQSWINLVE